MTEVDTERTPRQRAPYAPAGPYGHLVAGEELPARAKFEAVDPSTGEPWATLAQATPDDVDSAVSAARGALAGWRRTRPSERQELLHALADRIERDDDWPLLLATENGRPIREGGTVDVPFSAAVFRYYAAMARAAHGDHVTTEDPELKVVTVREPVGVVAALIPWNSPLITTAMKLAPALAAGNAVVLKPSELAAASVVEFGLRTADLLPPGLVNIVTGLGPEAGAALVAHPGVDKISFTGGVPTARHILRSAADHITPSLMELGGKSAFVICEDADLDLAVADAVKAFVFENGQVCFAASRLFLHASIRDEFLDRLVEALKGVRIGDAIDPATQMGPLVSAHHRERVLGHVEGALDQGAKLLAGGATVEPSKDLSGGYYLAPTVLEDPQGVTAISREEVFGPVTVVRTWTDEADVIAAANGTEYGLAAGVWTRDIARAHRFADALEAGTVWVNTWFDTTPGQPLGGIKASGYGQELSADAMREYSVPKAVAMRLSTDRPELFG